MSRRTLKYSRTIRKATLKTFRQLKENNRPKTLITLGNNLWFNVIPCEQRDSDLKKIRSTIRDLLKSRGDTPDLKTPW